MSVLFLDPVVERQVRDDSTRDDRWDEVWEGVLVVPPSPNTEHFRIVSRVNSAFSSVIDWDAGDQAAPGGNVSDRVVDWTKNYRIPDALVCLAGTAAVDHITHWVGGPDLIVEIISPGEDPLAKLEFYAGVGSRELLVIDRDPWRLELYQLTNGVLEPVGESDLENPAVLSSCVLPLTFQLREGRDRPVIHMTHTGTGLTWTA